MVEDMTPAEPGPISESPAIKKLFLLYSLSVL